MQAGFSLVVVVALLFLGAPSRAADRSCAELRALHLTRGAVTLAEETRELPATALVVPICRVAGSIQPGPQSDIHFEVWIPSAAWNGKYLQLGNGGFAGRIPYQNANEYLRRGYAVGVTDDGHTSSNFTDARWALGAPDRSATSLSAPSRVRTMAALAVLRAYAGHPPAKSYFLGCSNGGREALQAAQKVSARFRRHRRRRTGNQYDFAVRGHGSARSVLGRAGSWTDGRRNFPLFNALPSQRVAAPGAISRTSSTAVLIPACWRAPPVPPIPRRRSA